MILADTHVLVWLATGDTRLPSAFRRQIEEGQPLSTSAVVAFEYADLHRRGRLGKGPSFADTVDALGLEILPLPAEAWRIAAELPPVHGDPVDRMLAAHAMISEGSIATADRNLRRYPVALAW